MRSLEEHHGYLGRRKREPSPDLALVIPFTEPAVLLERAGTRCRPLHDRSPASANVIEVTSAEGGKLVRLLRMQEICPLKVVPY